MILMLVTTLILIVFDGWVLSVLWNWFVPNIFTGAPELILGSAIGVTLVVAIVNADPIDESAESPSIAQALFIGVFRGLVLLAIGFVVQSITY